MKSPAQLVLTDRDLAILEMVFSYGGCSVAHVQKRWFPTSGARSAAYDRVNRLVEAGYLIGHRLPSQTGQGSGKLFLTTGSAARPVLAKLLNCSSALQRQTRASTPAFLNHELAIVDFRLALELAVEASKLFTDLEWTPEWELRRRPVTVTDPVAQASIPLIADGAFTLTLRDRSEQEFLLEVDMATLAAKRLRSKLRGYLVWAKQHPVPVLWAAASADRAMAIADFAAEEAKRLGADPTIFWVTTQPSVNEKTVLAERIWQVVGGPHAMALGALAAPDSVPAARTRSLHPVGGP